MLNLIEHSFFKINKKTSILKNYTNFTNRINSAFLFREIPYNILVLIIVYGQL